MVRLHREHVQRGAHQQQNRDHAGIQENPEDDQSVLDEDPERRVHVVVKATTQSIARTLQNAGHAQLDFQVRPPARFDLSRVAPLHSRTIGDYLEQREGDEKQDLGGKVRGRVGREDFRQEGNVHAPVGRGFPNDEVQTVEYGVPNSSRSREVAVC